MIYYSGIMSYTKTEILEYLRSRKQSFYEKYRIIKIGIFGSYATETQNDESDIDIIVEFEKNTPNLYGKKFELREQLQNDFNKKVDVCREGAIDPIFKDHILSEAVFV
jgi:predicted nucleotidyltransferase